MKVERLLVKAFCKACPDAVAFKLDRSINKEILNFLVSQGFTELPHFTKSNILYIENANMVATGVFGQDTIQTKCKVRSCEEFINNFEHLLTKFTT